jgi:aryl-alcohol dehydrogenase-like predicted oxidoreductase
MEHLNRTKLTLGTVQLGLNYGIANKIGRPNQKEAAEILKYAILNGITEFDTAPDYGESEELIGQYFQNQNEDFRRTTRVFTKLPHITIDNSSSYSRVVEEVERSLRESMSKLKLPFIDGYSLHNEQNLSSHQGKIIDCLKAFKQQGLIKEIGASVYTMEAVEQVIEAKCFDMIQVPLNVFTQPFLHSGLLEELSKNHIKVYARSVYLQGLLLMKGTELPNHLTYTKKWVDLFQEFASDHHFAPSELAFTFVRDLPQIHSIVVGCETISQLKNNLNLMASPQLPETIVSQLLELFKDVPEQVYNPTFWK